MTALTISFHHGFKTRVKNGSNMGKLSPVARLCVQNNGENTTNRDDWTGGGGICTNGHMCFWWNASTITVHLSAIYICPFPNPHSKKRCNQRQHPSPANEHPQWCHPECGLHNCCNDASHVTYQWDVPDAPWVLSDNKIAANGNQDIKDDVWNGTSNVFIDIQNVSNALTKTE